MPKNQDHVRVSKSILSDLELGQLTFISLAVLTVLSLQADAKGVWIGSATKLAATMPGNGVNLKSIKRALASLEKTGHIERFYVAGRIGSYPVKVCRFLVTDSAPKGKHSTAEKSA